VITDSDIAMHTHSMHASAAYTHPFVRTYRFVRGESAGTAAAAAAADGHTVRASLCHGRGDDITRDVARRGGGPNKDSQCSRDGRSLEGRKGRQSNPAQCSRKRPRTPSHRHLTSAVPSPPASPHRPHLRIVHIATRLDSRRARRSCIPSAGKRPPPVHSKATYLLGAPCASLATSSAEQKIHALAIFATGPAVHSFPPNRSE